MDTNLRWERLGALSGVACAVLFVLGAIIGETNSLASPYDSSSLIASVAADHSTAIVIGSYLTLLSMFFFIWFLAYLRNLLAAGDGQGNWVAWVGFGGGLVGAAMLLLDTSYRQALTIVTNYGGESEAAKALSILDWNDYILVEAPALAALVGATTIIGFQRRPFPRWLAWLGVPITLFLLSPFLPGSGVMATFLWIALLSLALLWRTRKA